MRALAVLLLLPAVSGYAADYLAWDRVVRRHVNTSGVLEGIAVHEVDYCGIGQDPDFAAFLHSLAAADASGLSKNETYALYMNAYNALAVDTLIRSPRKDRKCIKSIQDIGPVRDVSVWEQVAGNVAGRNMSLNDIESLLRDPSPLGYTEDSRVHGCIVCASISCPNLRAEAYLPETIDVQMTANMRDWLANSKKGSVLRQGAVTVSKIFKWYAADMQKSAGSAAAFAARYAPADVREFILSKGPDAVQLSYFDYDWDANGPVPCDC